MEGANLSSKYIDEPYLLLDVSWGRDHYKSLLKSALALLCHAGLDPSSAEVAWSYLTSKTEERCYFPYYNKDLISKRNPEMPINCYYNKDLISKRDPEMPINCVYVKGDASTRELMAYVEIFGILRAVIRLSERYDGDCFERYYAFDPIEGRDLDVEIELDFSILVAAENETDYYGVETGRFLAAIDQVMGRAIAIANENELTRVVVEAVQQYFDESDKRADDPATDEEYRAMWSRIAQSVMPFFEHLHRPIKLPDHLSKQLSQNT